MNEITEKRSRLRAWLEQRRLHREVSNNGDRVSSKGKWYAWDKGDGVVTDGVFNCVGLAHAGEIGVLAHIAADRDPLTESGNNSFPALVDALVAKDISSIDVFGIPGDLTDEVVEYLSDRGIHPNVHINENKDQAFSIVIKGSKMEYWTE